MTAPTPTDPPREVRVLSVIPPMTQLNTPYPSTAYLTGFLRSRGVAAAQVDLALGLVLSLFSPEGLDGLRDAARQQPKPSRQVAHFLGQDRKSTRLNSSHSQQSRMPSSA